MKTASRKKLQKDATESEDDSNENVSICSVHFTSVTANRTRTITTTTFFILLS